MSASSPTPGTVPAFPTVVGVRNTLSGLPLVAVNGHLRHAIVAGEICTRATTDEVFETIVNTAPWPWYDQPPCNLTGVPVRFCINSQLGFCSEEFIFEGEDAIADIDWSFFPGVLELPAVTVNFGHGGVVQPVTLLAWSFESPGISCNAGETYPALLSTFVNVWTAAATGCGVHGLEIAVSLTTEEFGELEESFTWLGEDVSVEVDTGSLLPTPTASPNSTSVPTAAPTEPAATATVSGPIALPGAGGPPAADGVSERTLGSLVLGVLGVVVATVGIGFAARRRLDIVE